LPFVYLQTLLRLGDEFQEKLVTQIEALRPAYPATASVAPSGADKNEAKPKDCPKSTFAGGTLLGEGIGGLGATFNRVPLTKESLDLMDAPIPSGVLASEFAYHGLAPAHLEEMREARELLDKIYTELRK
jgi:hypothetical protein